jgi:hypothetical protein
MARILKAHGQLCFLPKDQTLARKILGGPCKKTPDTEVGTRRLTLSPSWRGLQSSFEIFLSRPAVLQTSGYTFGKKEKGELESESLLLAAGDCTEVRVYLRV